MAQFLRPDGNVTQSGFTGGFAEIDEATASDSDFAWGANNTAAVLEVSLSNATDPVSSANHVVRYRVVKTNAGTVDGGGNAVTVTAELVQGSTVIASDTAKTATGTVTGYSFTLTGTQADAITNYNDLRLRFTTSASGGGPSVRRGGAVSWAELEVPDAPPAAITTAQAGDSNVGSTWTGGVVPVAGQSVTINHAVTVPSGTTFPATGDLADLTVNANLTVNGTLNFAGNAVFAAAKLLGSGTFQGNPAAGQSKTIQFGTAHSQANVGAFMVGASAGSPAVIRKAAGSTGTLSITDGGFFGGGQADMQFVHLIGLGSASELGWRFWLRNSGNVFRLVDFICDACGRVSEASGMNEGAIYLLRRGEFKNSPQSDENVEFRTISATVGASGVREWDDVTFDKGVRHYGDSLTVHDCRVFGQYAYLAAATPVTEATWHDNYLYKTGVDGSGFSIPRGSLKRAYAVVDGGVGNPHFLSGQSGGAFTTHFNECVMEGPGATGTSGDGIVAPEPSVAGTSIVKNTILLPNAKGDSPGKIVSMLGGANYSVSIEHCTFVSTAQSGEHGVGFGETFAGYAGMIVSLKSNSVWTPPWCTPGSVLKRIANSTQDVVAPADCSHNGKWNLGAGIDGVNGYNGVGTVSVAIWSGTKGGANDTTANPQYVDRDRRLAKWDLSLASDLGSPRALTSITRSGTLVTVTLTGHGYAVGSFVRIAGATPSEYNGDWLIESVPTADTFTFRTELTPTTPASTPGNITREGSVANANAHLKARTTGYTPSALIDYVRAGFAPTNAAYQGTAHDGGDIGAVPFQSTGASGSLSGSLPSLTAVAAGVVLAAGALTASLPSLSLSATGTVPSTGVSGSAAVSVPALATVHATGDPAIFAYDTFWGPAQTLASHPPDTGGSWTAHPMESGVLAVNGAGVLDPTSSGGFRAVYLHSATPPTANYRVSASYLPRTSSPADSTLEHAVVARYDASARTGYVATYYDEIFYLFKWVAGTVTVLGDDWPRLLAVGERLTELALEVVGGRIRLLTRFDAEATLTERVAATDPSPITDAGQAGIWYWSPASDGHAGGASMMPMEEWWARNLPQPSGDLTATLPAVTVTASGTVESVEVTGSLTRDVPMLTATADAGVVVQGSSSRALPMLAIAASAQSPRTGDLTRAVPMLAGAAAGAVRVTGAGAGTIPTINSTGQAVAPVTGLAGMTVPPLTSAAAGVVSLSGTLSRALPMVTATADADLVVRGALSRTLPMVTVVATATRERTGELARTLPALAGAAAGVVRVAASSTPALPALTSSGGGAVVITGSLSRQWSPLQTAASGSVATTGTLASALPPLTGAAAASALIAGDVAASLPRLEATGDGVIPVAGALERELPMLTGFATSGTATFANLAADLPRVTLAASASTTVAGDAAASIPALTAAGDADVVVAGALARTIPVLSLAGAAVAPIDATGTGQWPALVGNASGAIVLHGSGTAALPGLALTANGATQSGATLAVVLPMLDLDASGVATVVGAAGASYASLTLAASASVDVRANLDANLASLTLTGAGTVVSTDVTGALARSFAALALAASASVGVAGDLAATLPALFVTAPPPTVSIIGARVPVAGGARYGVPVAGGVRYEVPVAGGVRWSAVANRQGS